ncbi:MAG TPA: hypothetical protein VFS32_00905 [Candidatus Limnocylindrales bacterium]|nr:hypothetical protein [Candidatus Limnocylindrales bacterium]
MTATLDVDGRSDGSPRGSTSGLELVALSRLTFGHPTLRIGLSVGDRPLVAVGETVTPGGALVDVLRDPRIEILAGDEGTPGARVHLGLGQARDGDGPADGELLFTESGRRRVVVGDHVETIEAPASGVVRSVRPGIEVTVELDGSGLPGTLGLGVPTHGRLELATDEGGELRPGSVDVGRAGTILVVGSRVDAETLTRARAMGVRGVVVAALPGKDTRDFAASERRQRAALHRLPPFAVLVLEGAIRRPIAPPVMDLLRSLDGREVGLSVEPPALVFEGEPPPPPQPDLVVVRHGPFAGRTGTFVGLAGIRRFRAGVHLEAASVRFPTGETRPVPLADLVRFG